MAELQLRHPLRRGRAGRGRAGALEGKGFHHTALSSAQISFGSIAKKPETSNFGTRGSFMRG